MNKLLVLFTFISLSIQEDPCCEVCPEGMIKVYSIVTFPAHNCGESCIVEKEFWKYKIFEWGLTKAEGRDQHVCVTNNFSYSETVVHGVPGIFSIKLDLYTSNNSMENRAFVNTKKLLSAAQV